jgi:hypothetical protein
MSKLAKTVKSLSKEWMKERSEMTVKKSKSSTKKRPTCDSTHIDDDFEQRLRKVIKKNPINLMETLEPIFTAVRMQPNNGNTNEDVSNKYQAFLQGVSQVMNNNNIFTMKIGYFIDPHSYNSPYYAILELNSNGLFAEHCDGLKKIENVMDVLHDLHEPEFILRTLIDRIAEKTNTNKCRIAELESCLARAEKVLKNSNINSSPMVHEEH